MVGHTRPKSAHRILQEVLAQIDPTTNTNGHTYQGLLQIIARRLGTNTNGHTYQGLILEVPPSLADTSELTTALTSLRKIQLRYPTLSILVAASTLHARPLPPTLFTDVITVPKPTLEDLKHVVREIIPTASEELAALIVAYTCKIHTYNLAPTTNRVDTATELAHITLTSTVLSHRAVTDAFHALIGRTVIEKLTTSKERGSKGPRSCILLPVIVAAAIDAHASIVNEVIGEGGGDSRRWIPIQSIYRKYNSIAHTGTGTGRYNEFTKTILHCISLGYLIEHPTNSALVAINPILTDTQIIPHILAPPKPVSGSGDAQNHHQPTPKTPEHLSHIALLAAIVKTEHVTHPALFPTHRTIYSTYQTFCAKFNTNPKPLRKIYRSIQSLRKLGVIHVHRAFNKQGRPNQLLHHLAPNDIAQLRAKTHAIIHPHTISNTELDHINASLTLNIASLRSAHKQTVINTIAAIAAHTNKNIFNASNAYSTYTQSTPNPIPKHAFLATIRQLITDNIIAPLYRSADRALNITIALTQDSNKPPP